DEYPKGPTFLGVVDLQAAEELAVADQDDLALDVDAQFLQGGEVLRPSVIDIDDLTGCTAGDSVTIEGTECPAARRVFVMGDRRLIARQGPGHGALELQRRRRRRIVE